MDSLDLAILHYQSAREACIELIGERKWRAAYKLWRISRMSKKHAKMQIKLWQLTLKINSYKPAVDAIVEDAVVEHFVDQMKDF